MEHNATITRKERKEKAQDYTSRTVCFKIVEIKQRIKQTKAASKLRTFVICKSLVIFKATSKFLVRDNESPNSTSFLSHKFLLKIQLQRSRIGRKIRINSIAALTLSPQRKGRKILPRIIILFWIVVRGNSSCKCNNISVRRSRNCKGSSATSSRAFVVSQYGTQTPRQNCIRQQFFLLIRNKELYRYTRKSLTRKQTTHSKLEPKQQLQ